MHTLFCCPQNQRVQTVGRSEMPAATATVCVCLRRRHIVVLMVSTKGAWILIFIHKHCQVAKHSKLCETQNKRSNQSSRLQQQPSMHHNISRPDGNHCSCTAVCGKPRYVLTSSQVFVIHPCFALVERMQMTTHNADLQQTKCSPLLKVGKEPPLSGTASLPLNEDTVHIPSLSAVTHMCKLAY